MDPVLVLHARGVVDDLVSNLCEVAQAMNYSLWSLRGNPCSVAMKLPAIARRMCILGTPEIPPAIRDEQMIGTVHIVRTSHLPPRCRISFHLEDLSGVKFVRADAHELQRFSAKSYMLLESQALLLAEDEGKIGTGPFRLPNIHVDTGPLRT